MREKEAVFCERNIERNKHCGNGGDKRIVDAGVEDIKIIRTECRYGAGITCNHRATHLCNQLLKIGKVYFRTRQKSMAKSRKLGIIHQTVLTEPPAAEQRSYEGSHNATKIDKDIENLETGITLRSIARIVVQLSDNGLKVALERPLPNAMRNSAPQVSVRSHV